ncbi:MAG: [FeFe] hydrogenase, group A [Patescibacteria group bacterium]|jgi:iron-only hydrogenase group A|nr:[FeFe] hydrogenase, group A [bacterium]HQC49509.1 [FeFe] hydrogenase, group A [bacterium]
MLSIKINNRKYKVKPGQTILEVAQANNIKIPSLCHHPDVKTKASCRVCVVEIKGMNKLQTACSTVVKEGMDILTESPRVKKARNLNIELIFAAHIEKCGDCTIRYDCDLLKLARDYGIKITRFNDRKGKRKTFKFGNAVEIDGTQCIDCANCVAACHRQGIDFLRLEGSGVNQEIKPVRDQDHACIYCGQCTNVCPVASAQEQSEWPAVERDLKNPAKIMVAQFAPAVRVSLGDEFGLPYGANCTKKINTALKKLGFDYVFDINFGADITTLIEAEELLEKLKSNKKNKLPMFTSCCPAWVAYLEFYQPELLAHLTTARSPQIHNAGAIKSYFAQKHQINPKDLVVVSIVPCTAKKYEARRPELFYQKRPLVDHVLTVREFAFLLKKHNIDLKSLTGSETDALFNDGSGAAAIYGASGGVMESALRSAVCLGSVKDKTKKMSQNKLSAGRLEFKEVRGLKGIKEATVSVAGKRLKVAVVNGIRNFKRLSSKLNQYHYVEVMACPGGCLGGGGQPFPTTDYIRRKRLEGMYALDKSKNIRRAHENQKMLDYYSWVKENNLSDQLLHTSFPKKK